jgi:hypothetical protein
MQKSKTSISILVVIIISGFLIFAISGDRKDKQMHEGTAMYFPTALDFAGESAPLQVTDVKERLDRELLINAILLQP